VIDECSLKNRNQKVELAGGRGKRKGKKGKKEGEGEGGL
jgi:hypothetical protein